MARVTLSLVGYNSLTDTDPDHFALYVDDDETNEYILIKEFARGSSSINSNQTVDVSHNLSYAPFTIVYYDLGVEVFLGEGNVIVLIYGNGIYNEAATWIDTTKIYMRNKSAGTKSFYYYIFYDNLT